VVITTRDLTPDDRQRLRGVEMILLKGAYMRGTPARGAQPGDGVCLDRSSQYPSLRIVDIRPKNAYKVNYLYIADRVSMYTRMFYTERGLLL
jgi:hypothetical protein